MNKVYAIVFFLLLAVSSSVEAQELNCQVAVNSQKIQTSEKDVFETLQKAVFEFMNDRKWTNIVLEPDEKIECSIFITINSKNGDKYSASLQVQSRRPVYNTDYTSVVINHKDNNFNFTYVEHDALEFQTNTFTSNLTSTLAFYAYMIIGYDFDSFSLYGGTPFFNEAQTIVNNAQNASETGWKSFESTDKKNRYWLIENVLNSAYDDYRVFLYKYHRFGLDVMYKEVVKGRTEALKAVELMHKVFKVKPNLFILSMTMDAKRDEFVQMFIEAPLNERQRAKKVFMAIDPAKADDYNRMVAGPKK